MSWSWMKSRMERTKVRHGAACWWRQSGGPDSHGRNWRRASLVIGDIGVEVHTVDALHSRTTCLRWRSATEGGSFMAAPVGAFVPPKMEAPPHVARIRLGACCPMGHSSTVAGQERREGDKRCRIISSDGPQTDDAGPNARTSRTSRRLSPPHWQCFGRAASRKCPMFKPVKTVSTRSIAAARIIQLRRHKSGF